MVLGFKQKFPWGEPTYFREKILAGVGYGPIVSLPKIHTIRAGNRWRAGDKIHMAYGVRTKNYEQFNKGIPELAFVKSVQKIEMWWDRSLYILIDGKYFEDMETLSINDGFNDVMDFQKWFNKKFTGQIIHWTNFRY